MNTEPNDAGAGQSNVVCSTVNYAKLELLNDDCLREICKHLDIVEVAQLSATCMRLQEFANDCVFPKLAKKVTLQLKKKACMSEKEFAIEMVRVTQLFESFGGFVEQLAVESFYNNCVEFDAVRSTFEKTMLLCPNLNSLHMESISFTTDAVGTLNNVPISLKELKIMDCKGITDAWSDSFQRFPKLEYLHLSKLYEMSIDFFKNITNLSVLIMEDVRLKETDLEQILDRTVTVSSSCNSLIYPLSANITMPT